MQSSCLLLAQVIALLVFYVGLYVYEPSEWEEKGLTGTELADKDLKKVLEGLAKHLFGDVKVNCNTSQQFQVSIVSMPWNA